MELKYIKCRLLIKKTKFYLVLSQTALSFTQRCPGQRLLYSAQARKVISFASAFSQTALSYSKNVNFDVTHPTLINEEMEQAIVVGRI